ncbi:helix-turn-helix domain-containing protein [Gemmatimonas sp. UBA7669]|uniref:helix-turn-helix domain-containing protein n=1 Tax=Gemmatimonas sp. UBA7669 TaxID=1946568 RepID=UPI0025B80FEF|nr:helix-turn-helix domain-containing protein [Gemmatimonas sp. UBA7669]
MRERPILMSAPMVRALLNGTKAKRKLYAPRGVSPADPVHLARRLANGLSTAEDGQCWIWQRTKNNAGYGTLRVEGRTIYAHRLAFLLAGNDLGPDQHVLHACDTPACINPDHLSSGSRSANMQDAARKGRLRVPRFALIGSANPASKLSVLDVAAIRELARDGWSQSKLAEAFNVSQSQISNIVRGRQWRAAS